MSNDWNAFRERLEHEGVIYSEEEVQVIPRLQEKNLHRWSHICKMATMIQKKQSDFVVDARLDMEHLFDTFLYLIKKDKTIFFSIDELLEALQDVDRQEGVFDFEEGSSKEYAVRIKQAFALGKEEFAWRKGKKAEECAPTFLVGAPPKIPRAPEEE